MAPSINYNNTALREVFLPGQIFVFGGFALRANSLGHLEQINSYAPGHEISFGNLDYVADIRGDLIFQQAQRQESRARRTLCGYRAQHQRTEESSVTGNHHKAGLSSGH